MAQLRMCPNCRAFVSSRERVCPYCEAELGPRAMDRREPAVERMASSRFTTAILLLINFGLYTALALASMRAGNADPWTIDGRTLFEFGAKYRDAILLGQWWRLVTAGFLHGGLFHILMNSWVLFDLGSTVEQTYGAARLIVVYFLATVGGFFLSTYWSASLSVGASAGIFGLIGAMIALGVRYRTPLGSAIRSFYMRWAIYGLVLGLLPGLHVDNAAHIGGLMVGLGTGYLAGLPNGSSRRELLWRWAAAGAVLVTALCFLQMYLWLTRTR
ncbi:MAG: rhomboid family intramembrane serine protease [Bryobacteraceae bacterium]